MQWVIEALLLQASPLHLRIFDDRIYLFISLSLCFQGQTASQVRNQKASTMSRVLRRSLSRHYPRHYLSWRHQLSPSSLVALVFALTCLVHADMKTGLAYTLSPVSTFASTAGKSCGPNTPFEDE